MYFYLMIVALIFILYFFGKDIQNRWFAFFMSLCTKIDNPKYQELKKDLLKPISSLTSHDPKLRKEKGISILEIGVGTGTNFDFYPKGTKLTVVDPNPHFAKYYNENRKKFGNIKSEEIIVSTGEEMDMVESNSVDVVVMTLVMCSVQDIKKLTKQIHRVLCPGGKFFFIEHIYEFDEKFYIRRLVQQFLSVSRIWPILFDGCCLNRDMVDDIKAAFPEVNFDRFYAPVKPKFLAFFIAPHLKGVATK